MNRSRNEEANPDHPSTRQTLPNPSDLQVTPPVTQVHLPSNPQTSWTEWVSEAQNPENPDFTSVENSVTETEVQFNPGPLPTTLNKFLYMVNSEYATNKRPCQDVHLILGEKFLKRVFLDNPILTNEIENLVNFDREQHQQNLRLHPTKYRQVYRIPELLACLFGRVSLSEDSTVQTAIEPVPWTVLGALKSIFGINPRNGGRPYFDLSATLHENRDGPEGWHVHIALTNFGSRHLFNGIQNPIRSGNYIIERLMDTFVRFGLFRRGEEDQLKTDITVRVKQPDVERIRSLICYIFDDVFNGSGTSLIAQMGWEHHEAAPPNFNTDFRLGRLWAEINPDWAQSLLKFAPSIVFLGDGVLMWLRNPYQELMRTEDEHEIRRWFQHELNAATTFDRVLQTMSRLRMQPVPQRLLTTFDLCWPMLRWLPVDLKRRYLGYINWGTNRIPPPLTFTREFCPEMSPYIETIIHPIHERARTLGFNEDCTIKRSIILIKHLENLTLMPVEYLWVSGPENHTIVNLNTVRADPTGGAQIRFVLDREGIFDDDEDDNETIKTTKRRMTGRHTEPQTILGRRDRPSFPVTLAERQDRFREEMNRLRGGMPRAKKVIVPEDPDIAAKASQFAVMLNETKETPRTYLQLCQMARKLNINPDPKSEHQITVHNMVYQRMAAINEFDIGNWIRLYVEISGCMATQNTFEKFQQHIKVLQIMLPEMPRQDTYNQWTQMMILTEGKTTMDLRIHWTENKWPPALKTAASNLLKLIKKGTFWTKLSQWLVEQFMPIWHGTDKHPYERKALFITGPSNCGKTIFVETFFKAFRYCTINLAKNNKYQSNDIYSRDTIFWLIKDLNDVSLEKLQQLQNVISDSCHFEAKYIAITKKDVSKPFIVCYATEEGTPEERVWDKFASVFANNEHDLQQFKKRLHHIHFTNKAVLFKTEANTYCRSDLLDIAEFPFKIFSEPIGWTMIDLLWQEVFESFKHYQSTFVCQQEEITKGWINPFENPEILKVVEHFNLYDLLDEPNETEDWEKLWQVLEFGLKHLVSLKMIINTHMNLADNACADMRHFLMEYFPKKYKQTRYGLLHVIQFNCKKHIAKLVQRLGANARKAVLRHLTDVLIRMKKELPLLPTAIDGSQIIENWDGNDINDPAFLYFAQILLDADRENKLTILEARDFFNDVRNAMAASTEHISPEQAQKIAVKWVTLMRDQVRSINWNNEGKRKKKISKSDKTSSKDNKPVFRSVHELSFGNNQAEAWQKNDNENVNGNDLTSLMGDEQ